MLLRLYNDDTPLMDHSKDRFLALAKANGKDGARGEVMVGEDGGSKTEDEDESLKAMDEEKGIKVDESINVHENGTTIANDEDVEVF